VTAIRWIAVVCFLTLSVPHADASGWRKETTDLLQINKRLKGVVIDHTANHGKTVESGRQHSISGATCTFICRRISTLGSVTPWSCGFTASPKMNNRS